MVDVRIKPLKWEQDEYGCYHAETEIGEYIAWPNGRAQFGPFRTTHVNGGEKGAMAAGEADYERRIRSTLSDAVAEREAEPVAWQPIETAPKGCVTEDAGCRGASEWFFGRVSPEFRKQGAAPFVVIRRRAWPQEDSWCCNGEAHYVPRYFDAWAPLNARPPTSELEALRKRVAELEGEREEDLAAREIELAVSFDNGHYRAMSEHATPWQKRAEAAEARVKAMDEAYGRLTSWLSDEYDDTPNVVSVTLVFDNGEEITSMPLGDFRRARAVKEGE